MAAPRRILATVTGSPSHARAVLPFARALAAAGQEVVVACPDELAGAFTAAGLEVATVMPPMAAAVATLGPQLAELEGPPTMDEVVPLLFAGPHVADAVRALRPVADRLAPDLVLRDGAGPPVDPSGTLRALVDGLGELDCEAVVATGGVPVADGAPPADHVHVLDWVPQPLLLSCADLLVTHGGYNSIREAVRSGTPMVVLPQFGDQEANADRTDALGLGRRTAADGVAATCAAVLADDGVRAEVRRAQRAMLALPPVAAAADDLAALAGA